jgi:hypothetical protein
MMPDIRFSQEITGRLQFGALCQRRGLIGTAIELGVNQGHFAGHFLSGWQGPRYVAVDHFLPYRDHHDDRRLDRQIAHATLARFGDRVEWRETDTIAGLGLEPDDSADFIYLDAGHVFWEVLGEMEAAWPKLKPGGILAGHDYWPQDPGVLAAVRQFSAGRGLTIWLTSEDWDPWSWYCYKPEEHTDGTDRKAN